MPLVAPLTPPSSDESEAGGTVLDPLNFVKVLIPLRFPSELSINLNCVSILSSSSSQSSPSSSLTSASTPYSTAHSYSSPHSTASSHHDESSLRSTSFEPIDEVSEDELERILRADSQSDATSFRDDYTECDLDLDDVDLDEFGDGSRHVTSTVQNTPTQEPHSDNEDEQGFAENPNPVPCGHCQGGTHNSTREDLIWPIQLDLDLVKTLLHLCPDFFEELDEVEMDSMEFTSSSSEETPSSTSASQDIQSNLTTGIPLSQAESSQPSPRNVQVDDSPLQPCLVRNKESLKVKLLLRRPMNQLIEQGILPPSKTPPAFVEQRVRLERARMGDLLKAKIQQRPARQELIRQHILEESDARVAPSLVEKQRMLKRARLADSLNDHLIHRPGPLELVKKNILHAPDAVIDQAIKEGVVPFKATSEGLIPGPHVPSNLYLSEDDSSSDLSSPADQSHSSSSSSDIHGQKEGTERILLAEWPTSTINVASIRNDPPLVSPSPQLFFPTLPTLSSPISSAECVVGETAVPPPPPFPVSAAQIQNDILSRIVKAAVTSSTTPPITSAQLTLSKLSTLEHQQLISVVQQNQVPPKSLTSHAPPQDGTSTNAFSQQHASSGKTRSAKKSTPKIKSTPKARQIKFHEYKGPPSAQKGQSQTQQQEVESSYELLLQQQQLFLQWQLECRHKYPQIILPAVSKLASPTEVVATFASAVTAANAAAVSMVPGSIVTATTSTPLVRSPSSIASVMNSNNTGTSGQQPIAPAPPPPVTVQALVEKYNKNLAAVKGTLPLKFTVSHPSTSLTDIRLKLTPSKSVDLTASPPTIASSAKSYSNSDLSKLRDWKVSDLKAELKKRNLPVSGAKPQLIERLKMADVSLQDESISSSSNANSNSGNVSKKSEGESTSTELMDVSDGPKAGVDPEVAMKTNNVAALNAAMLTLLQNNNLQSNGVIPVHILNALTNVATNAKAGTNGKTQNIVVVDEKLLREQQMEQLQNALKVSVGQNPIKLTSLTQQTPSVAGQKHRLALQQHLQQKMQQQALQSQLQKLIQLHTLQQQQGQKTVPVQKASLPSKSQVQVVSQNPHNEINGQNAAGFENSTLTLHQFVGEEGSCETSLAQESPEHLLEQKQGASSLNPPDTNVPFQIVQVETSLFKQSDQTNNSCSNSEDGGADYSNTPQLQIREVKHPAFQTGENDSSQSTTKSGSFSSDTGDPMDHSWLLKINENPSSALSSDHAECEAEPSKNVVKEFANFFESFANGEHQKKEELKLQIPKPRRGFKSQMVDDVLEILIRNGELPPSAAQFPSTPSCGKSPEVLPFPQPAKPNENSKLALITTPPTPPPLPPPSFAVTLPTSITFSRSPLSNPVLSPFQLKETKGPPPPYPTESLSKEAQDILKISQDLSNFGKAHGYQAESQLEYDPNSFAMLLDEVEKDAMNGMDLDHEIQFRNEDLTTRPYQQIGTDEEMSDGNPIPAKQEDLLGELGTLLPSDLDVSMSMEMDYSDWLDQLLPENNQSAPPSFIPSNNNVLNNNFFMDYHSNSSEPFGNRDPLLSSSYNIFPGDATNEMELKSNRPSSPMTVGESALWDFC